MSFYNITTRIALACNILFQNKLPFDIVDMIIKLAFKEVNEVCNHCGSIDKCINCKDCRHCDECYAGGELCKKCGKDGWYFCAKHGKLQNDAVPETSCYWCYR